MCNKVDDFSTADSIVLGEETCDGGVTTCVRPILKTDKTYEASTGSITVKWGCGECTPPASCVSCEGEKCNAAPTFTCLATSDVINTDPVSTSCPDTEAAGAGTFLAETKCVRPKVKDDGTYMGEGTTWGCGVCETEENCDTPCLTEDCNTKAEAFMCHKYTKAEAGSLWAKDGEEDCSTKRSGCHMPTPNAAGGAGAYAGGSCTNICADDVTEGTCKGCTGALCNDIEKHLYCKTGGADAAEADLVTNFCTDDAMTKCKRPEISYEVVVGSEEYGCGDCTDGSGEIANCETCTGSDCNSIPTGQPKHKCYKYAFTDAKWVVSTDMTDCVSGDAEKKCNMPEDLDVKEGYSAGGCGPCKSEDEGCKVTEPEKNAGERAALSLLVTVLPLLYIML